jgi:hypothetical protein
VSAELAEVPRPNVPAWELRAAARSTTPLERLQEVARLREVVTTLAGARESLSPAALAEGGNRFLATRFGRLDLMQHLEGVVEEPADYAELLDRAMTVETPVGAVRFAGYEDLLRMKLAAGPRPRRRPRLARGARRARVKPATSRRRSRR